MELKGLHPQACCGFPSDLPVAGELTALLRMETTFPACGAVIFPPLSLNVHLFVYLVRWGLLSIKCFVSVLPSLLSGRKPAHGFTIQEYFT